MRNLRCVCEVADTRFYDTDTGFLKPILYLNTERGRDF
jgi:hypothetical protein